MLYSLFYMVRHQINVMELEAKRANMGIQDNSFARLESSLPDFLDFEEDLKEEESLVVVEGHQYGAGMRA